MHQALILAVWFAAAATGEAAAEPGGLDRAMTRLYNYDFAGAHALLDEELRARPNDPVIYAVRGAAYLFAEFERQHILELQFFEDDADLTDHKRLRADPEARERLFRTTGEARTLAEARLVVRPDDRDALFALCTAASTEADYTGLIEKRYFRTYQLSKESQRYARRLLALEPPVWDAQLTIGTAEYVVGSLNFFFRLFVRFDQIEGSKQKAVADLEIVAARGRYYRPFAKVLLAAVHLRENRPAQALALLKELDSEFPGNPLVKREIVRAEEKMRAGFSARR